MTHNIQIHAISQINSKQINNMIVSIIGWGLIALSWIIPGNTENRRLIKLMISCVAFGIFVGAFLHKCFK